MLDLGKEAREGGDFKATYLDEDWQQKPESCRAALPSDLADAHGPVIIVHNANASTFQG